MSNAEDFVIENGVLVEYKGKGGDVVIPEGVTEIGDGAFEFCRNLTSVTIPEGVTCIWFFAFGGCENLTSVTIPDGVTRIGGRAFSGCVRLTSIDIPDSVTVIGDCAFWGCESLKSLTIPQGVKKISNNIAPDKVFVNYTGIEFSLLSADLKLQKAVRWLSEKIEIDEKDIKEYSAFCKRSYKKVFAELLNDNQPEAVVKLLEIAKPKLDTANEFLEQSKRNVEIHGVLLDYHNKSFSSKKKENYENDKTDKALGLKDLTLSDWRKIYRIGEVEGGYSILKYKLNDEKVEIPAQICGKPVVAIGKKAFSDGEWNGKSLKEVIISEGIEMIGESCFCNCQRLEKVTIPESVKTIGEYAFYLCEKLKNIKIPNGVTHIEKGTFYSCNNLTSVTLPDGVKTIGWRAFSDCNNLKKVIIPASVTSIERIAFWNCPKLTIYAPAGSYAYKYASDNKRIKVEEL